MKFHHVSYIQTVHILYIPLHISLTHEKSSYQTVIPSSDGMLNASTDSVHVNIWWCTCVHTKRKHTRFLLSPWHTHTNTFTQPHLDWAFLFLFFFTQMFTHTKTIATCGRCLTLQNQCLILLQSPYFASLLFFFSFLSETATHTQLQHGRYVFRVG